MRVGYHGSSKMAVVARHRRSPIHFNHRSSQFCSLVRSNTVGRLGIISQGVEYKSSYHVTNTE